MTVIETLTLSLVFYVAGIHCFKGAEHSTRPTLKQLEELAAVLLGLIGSLFLVAALLRAY